MGTVIPPPGDILYEVVDGRIIETPPMGAYAAEIASILGAYLGNFARTGRLGRVVIQMLFEIDAARDLQRRPDVAFVSDGRWSLSRRVPEDHAWGVVPDVAVEVVSPSNSANEVIGKVREYFEAGAERVWVIYPELSLVHIYETFTQIRVLRRGDVLEGDPLLPGFRLPLAELFEAEAP